MQITNTEIFIGVFTMMVVVGILSFILGKRKSNSPIKAGLMGFVFSIIPVLGLAYLIFLFSKEDVS